ncbi:MAG: Smr/MutS family protein, partial [Treponema sp.]|nr:Smr/MutS family protein [Treponema sp.]
MAGRSFADIYSQWEKTHDEDREIRKRANTSEGASSSGPTVNEICRMKAQDELDLHEMRLEEAAVRVREFLDSCYAKGMKKVRIVTGKGIHSKGGEAVLRPQVMEICRNHPKVREISV